MDMVGRVRGTVRPPACVEVRRSTRRARRIEVADCMASAPARLRPRAISCWRCVIAQRSMSERWRFVASMYQRRYKSHRKKSIQLTLIQKMELLKL